jgi:membrane protease YdiL (CAAX protease family)
MIGLPLGRAARTRPNGLLASVALVTLGILLLILRRFVLGTAQQVPLLIEIYAVLATMSLVVPVPSGHGRRAAEPTVLAIGLSAFVIATLLTRPPNLMAHGPEILLMNSAAAFSEEAFFRRLVYGVLERHAAVFAVVGSALLFAVIHVPFYGPAVFWLDLGAGLVFGWQRWASGSWLSSGATHAAANLLAVLR